jgi:hypothetical protein
MPGSGPFSGAKRSRWPNEVGPKIVLTPSNRTSITAVLRMQRAWGQENFPANLHTPNGSNCRKMLPTPQADKTRSFAERKTTLGLCAWFV